MEKLDFSKISTEDLRVAVGNQEVSECFCIVCEVCPYSGECSSERTDEIKKGFKDELARREVLEHPKLEPGMLLSVSFKGSETSNKYLYINDNWLMNLNGTGWIKLDASDTIWEVFKFRKGDSGCPFNSVERLSDSIWRIQPPKTENELKIEKLEKTVEDTLAQIKELKEGV